MLQLLINSLVQLILFAGLPLVWWYFRERKKRSFLDFLGLKKPRLEGKTILYSLGLVGGFFLLGLVLLRLVPQEALATNIFQGRRLRALPEILVYGIFNTALPEEVLFRGFGLKRLMDSLGFQKANLIQALLFGFLHGLMFFPRTNVFVALLLIAFTGLLAWAMGYINEKRAGGSILPSWFIHAMSNIFSGLLAAF